MHTLRKSALAAALTAVALATAPGLAGTGASAAPADGGGAADRKAPLVQTERALAGRYVVLLEEGSSMRDVAAARAAARDSGARVTRVYPHLRGYAAQMSARQVEQARSHPTVAFVQEDQAVTLSADQAGATWGLDRSDQRTRPLDGTYRYTRTGSGVRVFVIDTGINRAHTDFGGRVTSGASAINDGRGSSDCNGHGTHVAGTVGGARWGIAKAVTLVPVRVLDCRGSGATSGVIAGMDWVTGQTGGARVANMSLGGPADTATDAALGRMVSSGVTVVVAAGNESQNACNVSPARAASAITVASTTSSDARSSFSNYGSCVDLFAPGSSITSAWWTSTTATSTISGTSMASPHVAGAAALYLQGDPAASPATVTSALVATSTAGLVTGANGSPNRLLHTAP